MIITYLLLQAALFLLAVGNFFQVRQFLNLNPSIASDEDLENFKRMVMVNMYVTLVYIGVAVPVILLSLYLPFSHGVDGIIAVVALSAPQFALNKYLLKVERKSRSLDCAEAFADEHKLISSKWVKTALPDF